MTPEQIRQRLSEAEPTLLAFMDLARDRWGAKLTGLAFLIDKQWYGLGALGPKVPRRTNGTEA